MRSRILIAAFAVTVALCGNALASTTKCPAQVYKVDPEARPDLQRKSTTLCYDGFAVMQSGLSRNPVWVAERLTKSRVQRAGDVERVNKFHADPALATDLRSELSDFAGSGYDRGHMAPSGDMDSPKAQEESFSLANIVPQDSKMNRQLWRDIEETTRGLARRYGEIYVVTGPAYREADLKSLKGRVLVPTHIWKAIYVPSEAKVASYWATNDDSGRWWVISIEDLQRWTGVNPFPGLPAVVPVNHGALPQPIKGKAPDDGATSSILRGSLFGGDTAKKSGDEE